MKTRILTAVLLIPLLVLMVLILPKIVTAVVVGLLLAVASYELLYVTGLMKHKRLNIYAAIMAFLVAIYSYLELESAWAILGMVAFVSLLFAEMMYDHIKITLEMLALTMVGGLLVPLLLSSIIRIHMTRMGRYFVMVPFVMALMPDSGAYFGGIFFGKHKLAPVLSPKKTVEGVIGGVFTGMISMVIYGLILHLGFQLKVNYLYTLIYGFVGAMGAVFGDLCFSVIKRQSGIKDYGSIFPGHGGILDRFDSMVIVAPLAEVLLELIPFAG